MRRRRYLALVGTSLGSGCATPFDLDGGSPTPLVDVGADEWPMAGRVPRNNRVAAGGTFPATTSPSVRELELPAAGVAVVDGMGYGVAGGVVAFDPASGAVEWQTDLPGWGDFEPVVAEGLVLVALSRGLAAVDVATGEREWFVSTRKDRRGTHDPAWPPAVHDGTAYFTAHRDGANRGEDVGSTQHLYAVSLSDGRERWVTEISSPDTELHPSAAVTDGESVYVGGAAYDIADGTRRWQHAGLDDGVTNRFERPAVGPDRVFLSEPGGTNAFVEAVDPVTGDKQWHREVGSARGGVTLSNGQVYSGGVALDAATGETVWQVGPPSTPHSGVGEVHVTAFEETIVGLDPADGTVRWRHDPFPDRSPVIVRPPVVGDGYGLVAAVDFHRESSKLLKIE